VKGRRLICPDKGRIEVEEFEIPPVAVDQVLIENELTAVSVGTEIYCWQHGAEPGGVPSFPRTTGYCSCGVVVEAGSSVQDVKVGDRVAAQGTHASHGLASRYFYRVPEETISEDAVFLVMAAIAMHGIRRAQIQLGEGVAIVGMGVVGQLALSLCALAGAMPLIAIDLVSARLEKAEARGADASINPGECEDVAAQVRELCQEDGVDAVIEATGNPGVYPMAASLARTAGRLVALGSPRGTVEMDFMRDVHLREVDIIGAIQPLTPESDHLYYRWTKNRDRELLLQMMARGRLRVADLISHRVRPEACQRTYEMLAETPREALGVVFEWRGGESEAQSVARGSAEG